MNFVRLALLSATLIAFAPLEKGSANAGEIKTVVELYTSQGCSSCPPADALLQEYVKRPDVLALTLPVDYWDYLGWKDTFAKRAYSSRQRLYATNRGDGQVYTPQVVVNGLDHAVGSRRHQIEAVIAATKRKLINRRINATLKRKGNNLVVEATNANTSSRTLATSRVWLARIQKKGSVKIRRGENGGREITYFNVVREMNSIGPWTGENMVIRMPDNASNTDSYAVIFQDGLAGPILGAAELIQN